HYLCTEGSDFKVLGCTSLIPEGQWFGGNADGIHVRSNKLGPWVEGCLFEGVGDDAVALYSKAIFVIKQDSPTQLRLRKKFFNLAPGDRLALFNPREGVLLADDQEVADVERVPAGTDGYPEEHYRVTLVKPLAVTLETSSADPLENDQAFSRSRVNSDFAIRNNTFSCIRRFGTVVRADGGMIEGNVYDRISDIPVVFRNEPDLWYNGLNGSRIRIKGNTVRDSGFSQSSEGHGQIELIMYKMGRVPAEGRGHRDIRIEGNTISDWQDIAIRVENAEEVAIVDNTICAQGERFTHLGPHYGILVDNSANVDIRGNVFTDPRELDAEIEVTDDTSAVSVQD
ncbi:MAG: right-handed parallel beta-helix repeat-containing protein, partial [Verrucomicrobiota bacterium JB024]|nr:right-handed parallel beta-helix repeat-containing protein [Verrucomicrobiota bacterium JB024]